MTAPTPEVGQDERLELMVQACVEVSGARDGRAPLHCSVARAADLAGDESVWVSCCDTCHWDYRHDLPGMTVDVRGLTLCCAWPDRVAAERERAS